MITSILITLVVFLMMEGVTWMTHKYVMHGFMWYFHEDHHQPGYPHPLERNDVFFLIFALPSMLLMYLGTIGLTGYSFLFYIGLGITLYGLAYFLVHDVLIHQRFKWFKNTSNFYFRALRKAHKVHHKKLGKHDGECFGMLWVPRKYFIEQLRAGSYK